jgi:hypothetical protein
MRKKSDRAKLTERMVSVLCANAAQRFLGSANTPRCSCVATNNSPTSVAALPALVAKKTFQSPIPLRIID